MSIGEDFIGIILFLASGIAKVPGYVGIVLLLSLVIIVCRFLNQNLRKIKAIRDLKSRVSSFQGNIDFAAGFEEFRASLVDFKDASKDHQSLWDAWDEYRETLVRLETDGELLIHNSVRPGNFINATDLGFGQGFYRIIPNLFVSFGLFFTFMGLVAALSQLSSDLGSGGTSERAVIELMGIASAKFTMSLIGLFCSIFFGSILRWRTVVLEDELHGLCHLIERRIQFVSLEDIGNRQLDAATEQRDLLREIGMEMVAEFSRPLNALPETISESIARAMDPMIDKVGKIGASGMEGIVGDLTSQISHSVGSALTRASDTLANASDRIGEMVDRLNASNTQMGDGMQSALEQMSKSLSNLTAQVDATGSTATQTMNEGAERLLNVMNETLAGIRDNTAEGARAMSEAAGEMRKAAEGFRTELAAATETGAAAAQAHMQASSVQAGDAITKAGADILSAFGKTSADIAQLGQEMGGSVRSEIMEHLEALGRQLRDMVSAVETSAGGMRSAANSMGSSAEAVASASVNFNSASRDLVAAAQPINQSQERIENSVRQLRDATTAASETILTGSKSIADDARRVLETAQTALGNEREGIRQSMEAMRATLNRLSEEADKLDQIDEQLGRALKEYSEQLSAALGAAQDHIEEMRDTLTPGLDTLRSVVERAETFIPSSRRV